MLCLLIQLQVKRESILIIDLYTVCWYIFVLRAVEITVRNYMPYSEEKVTSLNVGQFFYVSF